MDLCNPVSGDFCRNRFGVFLFPARRQSIAGCGSFVRQQRSGDPAFNASVLGYSVNYYTGKVLGLKYFNQHSRYFKPEYMVKTNHYFMKHGGKTILIARFIPFVRSFGPFAAGSAHMSFATFSFYNIAGGILWIGTLLSIGYLLGNAAFMLADFF